MLPKVLALFCTLLVQQVVSYRQTQYRLVHEKIHVDDYNKDVIESPVIFLSKFNETAVGFSGSAIIKNDLSEELWMNAKVYLETNGEYKLYPAKLSLNLCEAQKRDTFGTRDIFNYSNVTDCPIKQGSYYLKDYRPDESKFPAFVPYGKLMVSAKVYDSETYLGSMRWWGSAEPLN